MGPLSYIVNTIVVGGLAMQWARASTTMVWSRFARSNQIHTTDLTDNLLFGWLVFGGLKRSIHVWHFVIFTGFAIRRGGGDNYAICSTAHDLLLLGWILRSWVPRTTLYYSILRPAIRGTAYDLLLLDWRWKCVTRICPTYINAIFNGFRNSSVLLDVWVAVGEDYHDVGHTLPVAVGWLEHHLPQLPQGGAGACTTTHETDTP